MTPAPMARHRAARACSRCWATRSPPTTSRPAGNIAKTEPGRALPDRTGRAAGRLQLLRRAARQPRGHDARHLRQHPPAQPAGARHRGRRHGAPARAASRCRIYDAAMQYKAEGTPLSSSPAREYGTGSSRDWAAKGTMLLGVKAVIAESFERIHRSNLIGMGVLPLQFLARRRTRSRSASPAARCSTSTASSRAMRQRRCTSRRPPDGGKPIDVRGARAHRHAQGARVLPPRRHPAVRAAPARSQRRQRLTERASRGPHAGRRRRCPGLAVFDLDGTITRHDTLVPYVPGFLRAPPARLAAPARACCRRCSRFACGTADRGRAQVRADPRHAGRRSRAEIEAWTAQFVAQLLPRRRVRRCARAHRARIARRATRWC